MRPILGIPGAATVGAPLSLGFAIASAAVSPSQDYVLAQTYRGPFRLVRITPDGPISSILAGIDAAPDRIVFSPRGRTAALVQNLARTAQIVTGLPESAKTAGQVDLSGLSGSPVAFAISDDGAVLLAGVGGEVFLFSQGNGPRSIAQGKRVSALAFLGQSHDALIADGVDNSIRLVRDAAGGAGPAWTFTDPRLPSPDSVQASADNQRVFAASSTNNTIAMIDSSGAGGTFVTCQCAPTGMHALSLTSVYQITEPSNGLLWIFDGSVSQGRVLFVPVPAGQGNVNTGPHHHNPRRP